MPAKRHANAAAAKEAASDAAAHVEEAVQKTADEVKREAQVVAEAASEVKDEAAAAVTPKEPTYMDKGKEAVHEAVETAKKAAEPYVEAARKTAEPYVDAARKTAEPYVDAARKTAEPYVESAKFAAKPYVEGAKASVNNMRDVTAEKVEVARKTAEPYVEAAKDAAKPYVEGAKASVNNMRDNVHANVQEMKEFDITQTQMFAQVAQLVAYLIFCICQIFHSSPQLRAAEAAVKSKAEVAQVPSMASKVAITARTIVSSVPVVGPRTVEIVDAFVAEVSKALRENHARGASVEKKTA